MPVTLVPGSMVRETRWSDWLWGVAQAVESRWYQYPPTSRQMMTPARVSCLSRVSHELLKLVLRARCRPPPPLGRRPTER